MMVKFEDSIYYQSCLHTLRLPFGIFYLCDDYIVSEVYQNVSFGTEEADVLIDAATAYYKSIDDLRSRFYIANRINKYSVKPVAWLSYKHLKPLLSGYCVVDQTRIGILNALLESKFVPVNFKSVKSLGEAVEWSKSAKKAS